MNATPQAKAYVRAIKNATKKAYAQSYLLWLCKEWRDHFTGEPCAAPTAPAGMSYMVAQAVRMNMRELMPEAVELADLQGEVQS